MTFRDAMPIDLPQFVGRLSSIPTGKEVIMPKMYANAKNVLPEDLLNQIKPYFAHGLLYVAGTERQGSAKAELVLGMAAQGAPKEKIAATLGITRRRVNQIVAGQRLTAHDVASDPVAILPQGSDERRDPMADTTGTFGTDD